MFCSGKLHSLCDLPNFQFSHEAEITLHKYSFSPFIAVSFRYHIFEMQICLSIRGAANRVTAEIMKPEENGNPRSPLNARDLWNQRTPIFSQISRQEMIVQAQH